MYINYYYFTAPPFPVGFMPPMPPGGASLAPAPPVMDPSMIPQPPQQPPPPQQIIIDDEPPNKKMRSEDHLIPENQFLALHNNLVTLQIQVPNLSEKSEWRLNGQSFTIALSLTDSVSVLKMKIQDETGMPPAKQKISYEGMFFKDNNSLAYYNLMNGSIIFLQIKERGGRKK